MKRICLYAGPGAGKSTTAAFILCLLKSNGYQAEIVREVAQRFAYDKVDIHPVFDQPCVTGEQLRDEMRVLRSPAIAVCESPIGLSPIYGTEWSKQFWSEVNSTLEDAYPTLNIFIDRGSKPYTEVGGYQKRVEAEELDKEIKRYMTSVGISFHEVEYRDEKTITELIKKGLE